MSNRYLTKNKECSHCGMLCDEGAFKLHTDVECFMIQGKRLELENLIKDFDKKEVERELSSVWLGN